MTDHRLNFHTCVSSVALLAALALSACGGGNDADSSAGTDADSLSASDDGSMSTTDRLHRRTSGTTTASASTGTSTATTTVPTTTVSTTTPSSDTWSEVAAEYASFTVG